MCWETSYSMALNRIVQHLVLFKIKHFRMQTPSFLQACLILLIFIPKFKIIKRIVPRIPFWSLTVICFVLFSRFAALVSSSWWAFWGLYLSIFMCSVWLWKCESVWKACSVCLVLTSEEFFLLSILCLFPKA